MAYKYVFITIVTFYLMLITFVSTAVGFSVNGVDIATDFGQGNTWSNLAAMLRTFWSMLSFQVDGMPTWFPIFAIYPFVVAIIAVIIDVIKDVIPFT